MTRLLIALCLLASLNVSIASAQRVDRVRAGLSQVSTRPASPDVSFSRAVPWRTGALVGFVVGAAAGVFLWRGSNDVSGGVVIFMGGLGALAGALIQAMSSRGP